MKKIFMGILVLFVFICMPNIVQAKEDVTIYLFRGNTCEHCEAALTYINKHKDELPEGVKFVTYEVWKNSANSTLFDEVSKKVEVEDKYRNNVPLFVIGNQYIVGYSGITDFTKMIDIAKSYTTDDDYQDVVDATVKELNINVKSMTLEQIFAEPNKVVTIVVYSIFGVIVIGIGAMILFSRKGN